MQPVTIFNNTRHFTAIGILALGLLLLAPAPAQAQEVDTLSYVQMDEIILSSWFFTDDVTGSYIKFNVNNTWPAYDIVQIELLAWNDVIFPAEKQIILSSDSTFVTSFFDTIVVFEDTNDVYPNWKTCDLSQSGLTGLTGPIWMSVSATGLLWDSTNVSGNSFIGVNGVIEPSVFDFAARLIVKRNETVGVREQSEVMPSHFNLHPAYPNPFNPSTKISYSISELASINITVYDEMGKQVRHLYSGRSAIGTHSLEWDGLDEYGRRVASGHYICVFRSKGVTQSIGLTLIK